MKKIVLMGDPNVGKSVLFSRLTGVDVITSNYPGTTVDYSKGRLNLHGKTATIIDAPGTYSLETNNKAEQVAVSLLDKADVILNVIDATNLERCLLLTLELLQRRQPVIVALNMWDEAQHLGIKINTVDLERILGVPVITTVAITGEGLKELVQRLDEARISDRQKPAGEDAAWAEIGHIVRQVQAMEHRHHSFKDWLEDATVKPGTGWMMALVILSAVFGLVRVIGEGIIRYLVEPLFNLCRAPLMALGALLGEGFLRDVLIGKLIDGQIDFVQSMGILTTGLFVPFGMVLPYIIAFYLVLSLLEDSGYLPRLATIADTVFHRLGMHGHGILTVLLGLGCNVSGVLAARTLETKKQRFIAATLVAVSVPCMAQTAMIFGVLGRFGAGYILLVFGTLVVVYVLLGLVLNKTVRGECPEIFLDIPPYRWPSAPAVAKKTWMRVRWFLIEAVPFLFLGVLAIVVLDALGVIRWLALLTAPFTKWWLGLPGEAVPALLAGFLRKDLAVGMLFPLGLSPEQLTIAVTVLTFYFPCVATFAVLFKELRSRDMAWAIAIMVLTALGVGGLLNLILIRI
jgi:ferrous iron transport protein B